MIYHSCVRGFAHAWAAPEYRGLWCCHIRPCMPQCSAPICHYAMQVFGYSTAPAPPRAASSSSNSVGVGSVENMTEVLFPDSISGDSIKCVRRNSIEPNHAMLYQISTCYHLHDRLLCFQFRTWQCSNYEIRATFRPEIAPLTGIATSRDTIP